MDEEARFSEMLSTPSLRRHFLERVMLRTKDILECSTTKGKWAKLISCTSVFLQCKFFVGKNNLIQFHSVDKRRAG